jgi:hypothetical protein
MTDRRLHNVDEGALEDIIRGLPAREPRPDLRTGVFSASSAPVRRGRVVLRPVFATALVAALLLIDILVLKLQDGGLPTARSGDVVAASSSRAADTDTAWLAQIVEEAAPARIAWLQTDPATDATTYLALRASLLANGSGG